MKILLKMYVIKLYLGTAIKVDHTLGTSAGQYLYFVTDYFEYNNLARIASPIFDRVETDFCLEFWYVIDGNRQTALQIFQKNSKETLLWKLLGSQGTDWKRATIPISSDEKFSIIIQGSNFYRYLC